MHHLAIVCEHPAWFEPLFAALGRRGVDFAAIRADGHAFDPAGPAPARIVVGPQSARADPKVRKLVAALRSPAVRAFIERKYRGAVLPAF